MDIITKTVLNKVQSIEGYDKAVIAGGAVRDHIFGVPERDTDIFLPAFKGRNIIPLIADLTAEFKIVPKMKSKLNRDGSYKESNKRLDSVFEFDFEGKLFDIVATKYEETEDNTFTDQLMKDFNFGLSRAYYDGYITEETKEFKIDADYNRMTLLQLDDITKIGSAVNKYMSIYNRYKEHKILLQFYAACLELKGEAKEKPAPYFGKDVMLDPPARRPWGAAPARPVAEPVGFDLNAAPVRQGFDWNRVEINQAPQGNMGAGAGGPPAFDANRVRWEAEPIVINEGGANDMNAVGGEVNRDQLFQALNQIMDNNN